jgi:hypothetical protein
MQKVNVKVHIVIGVKLCSNKEADPVMKFEWYLEFMATGGQVW